MLSPLFADSTWGLHFDITASGHEEFILWAEILPNAQIKEEIHLLMVFLCSFIGCGQPTELWARKAGNQSQNY